MSVANDSIVFKGRVVFNQIKLVPPREHSDDSPEWPKQLVVNENSCRLACYNCELKNETLTFVKTWSLEFDKIHDFGFVNNFMIVADGELSDKKLFQISLDDQKRSNLETKQVSSKGAWKMSCLGQCSEYNGGLIVVYVKHTNDLHFYENFVYSVQLHSPFSGQVSQLELTNLFIIVGQLEKHVVQVFNYNLQQSFIRAHFQIDAFWGNFAVLNTTLFTSVKHSQKEVELTNLQTKKQGRFEAQIQFVPLVAVNDRFLLVKERHNNTTVHCFDLPTTLECL